jgi:hypothetical protein
MAKLVVLLAVAMMATQVFCAEVVSLESETEGDITYRISWTTSATGEETVSTGDFTIEMTGTKGSSGEQFLVSHPGYKCGGDDSPRCYTNNLGIVPTEESRGSATCPCDVNLEGYKEEDAKWTAETGLHQLIYLKAPDVGEITEVKVSTASTGDGTKWNAEGIKINTNSQETGMGSGVYYVSGKKIWAEDELDAKVTGTTSAGEDMGSAEVGDGCQKDADCASGACDTQNQYACELKCVGENRDTSKDAAHNCPVNNKAKITVCSAQACEEEMDKLFKFA